jgi:hypothetical protein
VVLFDLDDHGLILPDMREAVGQTACRALVFEVSPRTRAA